MGTLEHATLYDGTTWFFASKAKKEKFNQNAADYAKRLVERTKAKL